MRLPITSRSLAAVERKHGEPEAGNDSASLCKRQNADKNKPMNRTSTLVPMWQIDCDEFRKVGRAFELKDVTTPEHINFCDVFAARFGWPYKRKGSTVTFSPPTADLDAKE